MWEKMSFFLMVVKSFFPTTVNAVQMRQPDFKAINVLFALIPLMHNPAIL